MLLGPPSWQGRFSFGGSPLRRDSTAWFLERHATDCMTRARRTTEEPSVAASGSSRSEFSAERSDEHPRNTRTPNVAERVSRLDAIGPHIRRQWSSSTACFLGRVTVLGGVTRLATCASATVSTASSQGSWRLRAATRGSGRSQEDASYRRCNDAAFRRARVFHRRNVIGKTNGGLSTACLG